MKYALLSCSLLFVSCAQLTPDTNVTRNVASREFTDIYNDFAKAMRTREAAEKKLQEYYREIRGNSEYENKIIKNKNVFRQVTELYRIPRGNYELADGLHYENSSYNRVNDYEAINRVLGEIAGDQVIILNSAVVEATPKSFETTCNGWAATYIENNSKEEIFKKFLKRLALEDYQVEEFQASASKMEIKRHYQVNSPGDNYCQILISGQFKVKKFSF